MWRGRPRPRVCARISVAAMEALTIEVEKNGYAVIPKCISAETAQTLIDTVDSDRHSSRNLLANRVVRAFANSEEIRRPVIALLGPGCFAVRGIFFNKNPRGNWKVSWHQDCVIAVRERVDVEGWGPWSRKAGVNHVRPATQILRQMVSLRIHLDDCSASNGPLRVIPGSHAEPFLSDTQIQNWPKESAVTCVVGRGDAILMRPLLLHSSSAASVPSNRRVIHLEFAAHELPNGVQWHDRVC